MLQHIRLSHLHFHRSVCRMLFPAVTTSLCLISLALPANAKKPFDFDMVPSAAAQSCLASTPGANVRLEDKGEVQNLRVSVFGLPSNTTFAMFVIQVPKKPFGLVWYQADIDTNAAGQGEVSVAGIFSDETFIMAPGVAPAPKKFADDETTNPATGPVQLYHLGIWFADPDEGANAGCPGQTAFDGDHVAGVQVLNTSNFPDDNGPLFCSVGTDPGCPQ
jgi:hypothetical protein